MRMAVVYRSEKKKIIRSQLNIVKKVNDVLQNIEATLIQKDITPDQQSKAYTELLMKETGMEKFWRDEVQKNKELTNE